MTMWERLLALLIIYTLLGLLWVMAPSYFRERRWWKGGTDEPIEHSDACYNSSHDETALPGVLDQAGTTDRPELPDLPRTRTVDTGTGRFGSVPTRGSGRGDYTGDRVRREGNGQNYDLVRKPDAPTPEGGLPLGEGGYRVIAKLPHPGITCRNPECACHGPLGDGDSAYTA